MKKIDVSKWEDNNGVLHGTPLQAAKADFEIVLYNVVSEFYFRGMDEFDVIEGIMDKFDIISKAKDEFDKKLQDIETNEREQNDGNKKSQKY
jgi:hypothetical protein